MFEISPQRKDPVFSPAEQLPLPDLAVTLDGREAVVADTGGMVIPGWYGKLPGVGDFARRRLPEDFVRAWDTWLQAVVATTRTRLGPSWLDRYLTMPIWRFALVSGLLGETGWAGVLMPSVDRVGRQFPLTIASPLPSDAALVQAVFESADWYEDVEQAALGMLDPTRGPDELERALSTCALALPPSLALGPVTEPVRRLPSAESFGGVAKIESLAWARHGLGASGGRGARRQRIAVMTCAALRRREFGTPSPEVADASPAAARPGGGGEPGRRCPGRGAGAPELLDLRLVGAQEGLAEDGVEVVPRLAGDVLVALDEQVPQLSLPVRRQQGVEHGRLGEALLELARRESHQHVVQGGAHAGEKPEVVRAQVVVRFLHRADRREESRRVRLEQVRERGLHGRRELQRVVLDRHDHRDVGADLALDDAAGPQQVQDSLHRLAQELPDRLHGLGREARELR